MTINELKYLGSEIWERRITTELLNFLNIKHFNYSAIGEKIEFDLLFTGVSQNNVYICEIKQRYCTSDTYQDAMIEGNKVRTLTTNKQYTPLFINFYLDGKVKIFNLNECSLIPTNIKRPAKNTYINTGNNDKQCYFVREYEPFILQLFNPYTQENIDEYVIDELQEMGYDVPNNFTLKKEKTV